MGSPCFTCGKSLTGAFFRSPHITTLRERISIDGRPIAQPAFDALVEGAAEDIAAVRRDEAALSHFEAMTALALRHFKHEQVHTRRTRQEQNLSWSGTGSQVHSGEGVLKPCKPLCRP